MCDIQQSRVAIFSDVHLGIHMNNIYWHKVALEYAEWLVNSLKNKGIKEIIFCGDFFDSRSEIEQSTLNVGVEFLSKFHDFKIWMIVGNHDSLYKEKSTINSISPFRYWPNVTVVDKITVIKTAELKRLVLVPWGTEVKSIPKGDVIFGHFDINGFKLNTHELCTTGIDANHLLDRAPLVISGHYHLRSEKKFSKGTILYTGSGYELTFADAESIKGYYILNTTNNTYEFFENHISPKHFNLRLSDLVLIDDLESLTKNISNNLIKIIVDRSICPEDAEYLISWIKKYQPANLVMDYKVNFTPLNSSKESEDFSGISIERSLKGFIDLLEVNNKQEIYQYLLDLYYKHK